MRKRKHFPAAIEKAIAFNSFQQPLYFSYRFEATPASHRLRIKYPLIYLVMSDILRYILFNQSRETMTRRRFSYFKADIGLIQLFSCTRIRRKLIIFKNILYKRKHFRRRVLLILLRMPNPYYMSFNSISK